MEHVTQLNSTERQTAISTVHSQHLFRCEDVYVKTSFAVVANVSEILAFACDHTGAVSNYLDLYSDRYVEDTFENHERIARAAFRNTSRWDLPEVEEDSEEDS